MTERLEWHRQVYGARSLRVGSMSTRRTKPYLLPASNASGCSRSGCSRYSLPANAASNALANGRDRLRIGRDRREQDLVHQQGPERAVVQKIDVGAKQRMELV